MKFALILSSLMMFPLVSHAAADMKIGLVEMQKALQGVEAGKKARTQLEGEFNKKKAELQKEEAAIKKEGEEFQKKAMVMNDQAKAKKQQELQERVMKFQEMTARYQGEIQKKEQELTDPIIKKLRDVIKDIAQDKGYNYILEKNENSVLYSPDKDDITEQVIAQYNKSTK